MHRDRDDEELDRGHDLVTALGLHDDDEDLEPFLSEIRDETLPARWRLGSLLYLEARETFLSTEHRDELDAARERICCFIAAEARSDGMSQPVGSPSPAQIQRELFPSTPRP